LTLENKPANFDTGDRAVLMPQLGTSPYNTVYLANFKGMLGSRARLYVWYSSEAEKGTICDMLMRQALM
jgi:RAD51-like protein 2